MLLEARPRFAVYLRISRDPDGSSTATDRQLKDCQAFADLRGWDIVDIHRDADVSAFRKDVKRPAYQDLLAGLRAGQYDGVLVWRLDRLVRRTVEFGRFWELAESVGARLASATQPIDTSDPMGMLIVQILVAFAQMESETMSVRIKAEKREAAEAGKPKSTRRAYGIEDGWDMLVDAEAAVIQEAAARLLRGEAMGAVVVDFNSRGVPSPEGGEWNRNKLKQLMRSARLWGWREHHGELVAKGDWPEIIDEATGRALRQMFANRGGSPALSNRRRNLMSGLITCGKCGARLKAAKGSDGHKRYVCPPKQEHGCSGIALQASQVEATVEAQVEARLARPELIAAIRARSGRRNTDDEALILAEIADVQRKVDQSADEWARGGDGLPRAAYVAEQKALARRADELNARLAKSRSEGPLAAVAGPDPVRSYRALDVARKRAVIEALTVRITAFRKDDPRYLAELRRSLADEAERFDRRKDELKAQAAATTDEVEARALRDEARRYEKWASRRRGQVRDGTGGGRWRPERLYVEWR